MNRREFLTTGLAGAAAVAATGCATGGSCGCAKTCGDGKKKCPFRLGVAGYTLYDYNLDDALAILEKHDVHGFCAKDKHYPFLDKISAAELKALVKKSADHGVTVYGAGPISMTSVDEAKRAFEYAATLGCPTMVGVPGETYEKDGRRRTRSSRRMCEEIDKIANEYKINCAIHNHGANPKTGNPELYPTLVATNELIKDLSPRMGFCMDVAYTFADGFDPAEIIRRFAPRIFDVHFRNVSDPANGSSGAAAHAGKVDYVRVVRALKEVGYSGWCGLELKNAFAKPSAVNPGANPDWIPLSLGYFRGLMDAV